MIESVPANDGAAWLRSTILAQLNVPHGFSTRHCENPAHSIGLEASREVRVRQVHGCGVAQVGADRVPNSTEADALITDQPGTLLTVVTADCISLLVAHRSGRCVAAVHAGWRGVVAGVIQAALARLCEAYDITAADLVAAIGPCIGPEHFEVGQEVVDQFNDAGLSDAVIHQQGRKPHIDLTAAATAQLRSAGLPTASIDHGDWCTYRDSQLFHSYRRDGDRAGRMAAMIAVKQPLAA